MKHLITIKAFTYIIAFFTMSTTLSAQSNETIEMSGGGWSGVKFMQAGVLLDKTQLEEKLSAVPEAMKLYKSGKSSYTAVSVLSGLGGGLIGWNVANALRTDRDNKWWLAGAGATLILLSIPVANGGTNKTRQAIDVYNNSLTQIPSRESVIDHMAIQVQPNGIGLQLRF